MTTLEWKKITMAQKDIELLLKDLSSRLPYSVRCYYNSPEIDDDIQYGISIVKGFQNGGILVEIESGDIIDIDYIKPYLRPMSSMTEEENKEYMQSLGILELIHGRDAYEDYVPPFTYWKVDTIDFFNAHHFDYRGLIKKGLALEAPEGMYNIKEK